MFESTSGPVKHTRRKKLGNSLVPYRRREVGALLFEKLSKPEQGF